MSDESPKALGKAREQMSDDMMPETIFGFPVVRDPGLKAAEMRLGPGLFPPIKFRTALRAAPGQVVAIVIPDEPQ